MKFIIALSVFFAFAASSPTGFIIPAVEISAPTSSQYHAQDDLGQYTYGYANQLSAKAEARSLDGSVLGRYSYLDAFGKVQLVEYIADDNGFRVAASNMPVAPALPETPVMAAPTPVQDTPEVIEARNKHLAAVEEVKNRAGQNKDAQEDSVEIIAAKTDIAVNKEGPSIAITSTPLATYLPVPYRPAVYATPGVAIRSTVAPVFTAPINSFSYGINQYNGLYYYPGFTTFSGTLAPQFIAAPAIAESKMEQAAVRSEEEVNRENKSS